MQSYVSYLGRIKITERDVENIWKCKGDDGLEAEENTKGSPRSSAANCVKGNQAMKSKLLEGGGRNHLGKFQWGYKEPGRGQPDLGAWC